MNADTLKVSLDLRFHKTFWIFKTMFSGHPVESCICLNFPPTSLVRPFHLTQYKVWTSQELLSKKILNMFPELSFSK